MRNVPVDYEDDACSELESLSDAVQEPGFSQETRAICIVLSALTNAVLACAGQLERIANSAEDARKI